MDHKGFQMDILDAIDFPPMIRVRQKFSQQRIADVEGTIIARIRALAPTLPVRPGQSVALACTSRGLADYVAIVKSVVAGLREIKLKPFIIPAMGSHGAATASAAHAAGAGFTAGAGHAAGTGLTTGASHATHAASTRTIDTGNVHGPTAVAEVEAIVRDGDGDRLNAFLFTPESGDGRRRIGEGAAGAGQP